MDGATGGRPSETISKTRMLGTWSAA